MTKISRALRQLASEAKKSDAFWVETAKLSFAMALEARRRGAKLTYKALAERLGSSQAYVSKVVRGDTNLTIESMVKMARATGGQLVLTIAEESAIAVYQWDAARLSAHQRPRPERGLAGSARSTAPTTITVSSNDTSYALAA